MMFHVKQRSIVDRKKVHSKQPDNDIRALFGRIVAAFRAADPNMPYVKMAELITAAGRNCSERTMGKWSAGINWPGVDMMKAISKATQTSLDELVFGSSDDKVRPVEATDLINQVSRLIESSKQPEAGLSGNLSQTKRELFQIVTYLDDKDIVGLLEQARRLKELKR